MGEESARRQKVEEVEESRAQVRDGLRPMRAMPRPVHRHVLHVMHKIDAYFLIDKYILHYIRYRVAKVLFFTQAVECSGIAGYHC